MHPVDLEAVVGRNLRRLPSPRAPQTLLPRVLSAVQAWSRRPWYSREWLTWPFAWQLASAALLMAILVGTALVLPTVQSAAGHLALRLTSGVTIDVPQLLYGVAVVSSVAQVLWRAMIQPFLAYAVVVVGLMCLACAMGAMALNRAVFGRAFPL